MPPVRCHRNPEFNSCRKQFQARFGKPIEEYSAIKRAVEGLSETSKQNYYRNLPNYFMFLGEDPDTVIKNRRVHLSSDNPELEEFYERKTRAFIQLLKDRKLAGRGITGIVGRIGGFFSNNSKRYRLGLGRLMIPKARKTVKYSPFNNEVRELLAFADCQRDRLIVTLAYQSGPAPVDISELCRGDIPLEVWRYFERSRSKTGEVWRGVTTPDIVVELRAYLKLLGPGDASDLLFRSREGFLDNEGVSRVVSTLIDRAGFGSIKGFKPTSLRDAFEDALVDADINFKVKETLMAHSGNLNVSAEYGSEARMQKRLVEAMQQAYPHLCLNDVYRSGVVTNDKLKLLLDNVDELLALASRVREHKAVNVSELPLEVQADLRKRGLIK